MNWDAVILTALKILAVLALVLLNGFFVAAEFALVRIRETQLDMLVAKGWRRAAGFPSLIGAVLLCGRNRLPSLGGGRSAHSGRSRPE